MLLVFSDTPSEARATTHLNVMAAIYKNSYGLEFPDLVTPDDFARYFFAPEAESRAKAEVELRSLFNESVAEEQEQAEDSYGHMQLTCDLFLDEGDSEVRS